MSEQSPLDSLPKLIVSTLREKYELTKSEDDRRALMDHIREGKMLPYYKSLCQAYGWEIDNNIVKEFEHVNEEEKDHLEDVIVKATENKSEEDVRIGYQNLAMFHLRVGDFEKSKQTLADLLDHTVGLGQKIDAVFCQMRLGFFFKDYSNINELLDSAHSLINAGGDWERKNKLKVYEGLVLCYKRNFLQAAELFISTIATYAAVELFSHKDFIYRTVVLGILSLNRTDFRDKIVKPTEISQYSSIQCLLSLYNLKYSEFFDALVNIEETLASDIWFAQHLSYLIKELRVCAYKQFLEPYQTVEISAMTREFKVSQKYIEDEVLRFIFSRKLNAKIDRVRGIIITNQSDGRAAKMREALKRGEVLVARLQKLGRLLSA